MFASMQNRILTMIATYGSTMNVWPDRPAAQALLAADPVPPEIQEAMASAQALDAALAQDKVDAPSPALVSRILAMAVPTLSFGGKWNLAYAFFLAFLTGAGVAYAQTRSTSEAELDALSMLAYGVSITDSEWIADTVNTEENR